MYNILVCDDEKDIVEALGIYLSAEGYQVTKAYNGQEACEKLKTGDVQLVLMDIMMPVMDGITAMNEIRKMSNVPVILLTAKSEDTDKILGLSVGADDYITKPFNPVVMIARVKAQLRRYMMLGGNVPKEPEADTLTIGGVCLDDRAKKVTIDGDMVNLTKTEYAILKFLMNIRIRSMHRRISIVQSGRMLRLDRRAPLRYIFATCVRKSRQILRNHATSR